MELFLPSTVSPHSSYVEFFQLPAPERGRATLPSTPDPLSISEAYQIQETLVTGRLHGEQRVVGYKVGCTSEAIRQQFGLSEPIYGRLLQPEMHRSGVTLAANDFDGLAVEPEFVLGLGRDLVEPIHTSEELEEAIDYVAAGVELHHYHFWWDPPTIQELVLSNGIHAGLVIGEKHRPGGALDWNGTGVSLHLNGERVACGSGENIMGGPLVSLMWLANRLIERETPLRAGDLVIPGSPVELVRVSSGDLVQAVLAGIGEASVRFV